jgi:hypothetical protein
MSVEVSATTVGYTTTAMTSMATAPVVGVFDATPLPTISGTTAVGHMLTAEPGTASWSPAADSFTYQWLRAGVAIFGEHSATYELQPADLAQAISVTVGATRSGYASVSQTSTATILITVGTFSSAPAPLITGTTMVGETLQVDEQVLLWSPFVSTFSYEWNRDGTLISGANASSYSLEPEDAGHRISVKVTAETPGFSSVMVISVETATVTRASFDLTTTPLITGTKQVLQALYADVGTWAASPDSFTFAWLRGGVVIDGATEATYFLQPADAGQLISVTVTALRTGYAPTSLTSVQTEAIAPASFLFAPIPTVSGTSAVGRTLTADPLADSWAPSAEGFTYRWLRGGVAIDDATAPTYVLRAADLDAVITVTVMGAKVGFTAASQTSSGTPSIAAGTFAATPVASISGTTAVGETLVAVANPLLWSPSANRVTYMWKRNGVAIDGATASEYLLQPADFDEAISVTVTGATDGYTSASVTSDPIATIGTGTFVTTPTPTISGTSTVGQTLTAGERAVFWVPSASSFTYQWLRDGVAIDGATALTYVLQSADTGHAFSVTVTAATLGYSDASSTSADTDPVQGIFDAAPVPTISGTTTVGRTVTAHAGTWSPSTDSLTYQWFRGSAPIDGATSSTYDLQTDDGYRTVSVVVTAVKAGYVTATKNSVATATILNVFAEQPTPTISGITAVGQTLTADAGAWPPAVDSYTYQWLRDDNAIEGATSSTYDLQPAELGSVISVTVTAVATFFESASQTSTGTVAVAAGSFAMAPAPTILGTTTVGRTLTARTNSWLPSADSFTYVWKRAGVSIDLATSSTYVLQPADAGQIITVTITAQKEGYAATSQTSAGTSGVSLAHFGTTPTPTISGVYRVGQVLTADAGLWSPSATSLSYEWRRAGSIIDGATSASYTLTAADLGYNLIVTVTAVTAGYMTESRTGTAASTIAAGQFSENPVPTITGALAVGNTLTADAGASSPAADSVSYQWSSAGTAIDGATSATYALRATDLGHAMIVVVSSLKDGFTTGVQASAATDAVAPGAFSTTPAPTISGTTTVAQTLTANAGVWSPAVDSYAYQWRRDGSSIDGATSETYVLQTADAGQAISVMVFGTKDGFTSASQVSVSTALVATAPFVTTPTPTISGTTTVGETLTAGERTLFWVPSAENFTYQWLRAGVAIDGATSATYILQLADAGQVITVSVTAVTAGYVSTSMTSVGSAPVTGLPFETTFTPVIIGSASVGGALYADEGGLWTPTVDGFAYDWKRDGVSIPGAIGAGYGLQADDLGHSISVTITATKVGYEPTSLTSAGTVSVGLSFEVIGTPTISGLSRVGEMLSVSDTGAWSPAASSFTYQWWQDSEPIEGATSSTYILQPADVGAVMSVAVTAVRAGYTSTTGFSDDSEIVAPAEFVSSPVPSISGVERVGHVLEADAGLWFPTVEYLSFQWYRGETWIDGATASTYTLQPADAGQLISVVVTAELLGYTAQTKTSATTSPIATAPFVTTPTPTILGTTRVPETLTADPGVWSPAADSVAYQWNRNGVAIVGANSATYTLQPADAGRLLAVAVTATTLGYTSTSRTSLETASIALGLFADKSELVLLSGTPTVGETLTADAGVWSPTPESISYQWRRDAGYIWGATSSTYVLQAADAGSGIWVDVTASAAGYADKAWFSMYTSPVGLASFQTTANPTVSGATQVGETLTANTVGWSPSPDSFTYQWKRSGTAIDGATSSTYVLQGSDLASTISVAVQAQKGGYVSSSVETSAETAAIAEGIFATTYLPTIAGEPSVGGFLWASEGGTWSPAVEGFAYQWKRDGVSIPDANMGHYLLDIADLGHTISVTITGNAPGIASLSRTSEDTAAVGLPFVTVGTPLLSNTFVVGETISASSGDEWSPSADTFTYQWFRDGTALEGETLSTHVLTLDDVMTRMSVRVGAVKVGYTTTTNSSAESEYIVEPFATSTAPTIAGETAVGETLTAETGDWSPIPDGFDYQWWRGAEAILDGTSSTYVLQPTDEGHVISVEISAVRIGNVTTQLFSVPTAAIDPGTITLGAPTILGTTTVGQTLTASPGVSAPSAESFSYQWLRNGEPIDGAIAATYELLTTDVDDIFSVIVTADVAGYSPESMTSDGTASIAPASFVTAPLPTISGTPTVGQTLTAVRGTWSPTPDTSSYLWMRNDSAIVGAFGQTYDLQPEDAGAIISVSVRVTKAGYETTNRAGGNTTAITALPFVTAPAPTISGSSHVGSRLTANPGSWSPSADSVTYVWKRAGVEISGATASTYTLQNDDIGHPVAVTVTAVKLGYITSSQTSFGSVTATPLAFWITSPPTIVGTKTVGEVLTANTGFWSPSADTFSYVWKRSGVVIEGASSSTYALQSSDAGQTMSVMVTAVTAGYATTTLSSASTTPIQRAFLTTTAPIISGAIVSVEVLVGQRLTVATGSWSPAPAFSYVWMRDGVAIPGAVGAGYSVAAADLNAKMSVEVTAYRTGFAPVVQVTPETVAVSRGVFVAPPIPIVSGTASVGQRLTAVTGSWSAAAAFSYVWQRDGVAIPGAVGAGYTVAASDLEATIRVQVTASRGGFSSVVQTAAATAPVTRGIFLTPPMPFISGSAGVGQRLTAVTGSWSAAAAFSYVWKRDGLSIPGAVGAGYSPVFGDIDAKISVEVTAYRDGFTSVVQTTPETDSVARIPFTLSPVPAILGTPTVGQRLTLQSGSWSPLAGLAYTWRRDGRAISGATGSDYLLSVADADARITVDVTGARAGYATTTRTSAETTAVARIPFVFSSTPTLRGATFSGAVAVGQVMSVATGVWAPAPAFAYAWQRDGVAIAGGVGSTYVVTPADIGALLSVEVTAVRAGYSSVVQFTTQTLAVTPAVFAADPIPTVTGTPTVGQVLTADEHFALWTPVPDRFAFTWLRAGSVISGANAATYTLQPADAGQVISVELTAIKAGYGSVSQTSLGTTAIQRPFVSTSAPSISGTSISGDASVGQRLTVVTGSWSPAAAFSIIWKRDGVAIAGGVGAGYTVSAADVESRISVEVTAYRAGYAPVVQVTAETAAVTRGVFVAPPEPTIVGVVSVGQRLTVNTGVWSAAAAFAYVWKRDGIAIDGAVGAGYTVAHSDLDSEISVEVTAYRNGFTSVVQTTIATTAVSRGAFGSPPVPTILGSARVGQRLVAVTGVWSPAAAFSYVWKREGIPVAGAIGASYAVGAGDLGKKITLEVTAYRNGFTSVIQTTSETLTVTR